MFVICESAFSIMKRIKTCVRRTAKIMSIRTANESFDRNGIPPFAARKFVLKL